MEKVVSQSSFEPVMADIFSIDYKGRIPSRASPLTFDLQPSSGTMIVPGPSEAIRNGPAQHLVRTIPTEVYG